LRRSGLKNIFVLEGGLNSFFYKVFKAEIEPGKYNEMQQFQARFIEQAREAFQSGEAAQKINKKAKPVTTIVEIEAPPAGQGGC
jgi:hypothetical protein